MRAAQLTAFGSPAAVTVVEVPDPVPGLGEVVVAVEAAALNRRDIWVTRFDGYCELPVTLGSDASGRVVSVGRGADRVRVGDEVVIDPTLGWGDGEDWPGPAFDILGAPTPGTLAEQVTVPVANVHPKPEHLSWAQAAALNLGGLTAWRAVRTCAGANSGRSILVTGAGGGVATFAVQIAAALGATVWVTSGDAAKIERAVGLGAAGGVIYRDPAWPEALVEQAGGPLDAAVDSYGGPAWPNVLRALRPGGRLVSFGDTGGSTASISVDEIYWQWRSIVGTSMGSPRDYQALLAHVAWADWTPVIDRRFSLEGVADAIAALEDPARFGKIVIDIGASAAAEQA